MKSLVQRLTRKKVFTTEGVKNTELNRCLRTLDLVTLGVGTTLGGGIYVVAGQVAYDVAGPAVIISFVVAGLASALAALCYAEFAARIPRAGSAYVYSYVTVGEFMAFIIGWNLVLEYVIGTASVSRAWSRYFDSLIDYRISHFFREHMPMNVPQLSSYPDLFAFALTFLLSVVLAVGVKESMRVTCFLTCINMFAIVYAIICGFFMIDWDNWSIPEEQVPPKFGKGGFLPFGFSGVMSGAAICFYSFVGFDVIASTGEESRNPQRTIPLGIVISLAIICLCYILVSGIITLVCPYFLLDYNSPLPFVFQRFGWTVARYIVSMGALCGLTTSLLGSMFPMPRVLYAMGADGIIFRFMASIHPRLKTPVMATLVSGTFSGLMAVIFDVSELVSMMSIGTLLAYSMVSLSVLILSNESIGTLLAYAIVSLSVLTLRYEPDCNLPDYLNNEPDKATFATDFDLERDNFRWCMLVSRSSRVPTVTTSRVTKVFIAVLCICVVGFSSFIVFGKDSISARQPWAIVLSVLLSLLVCLSTAVIWIQPKNPNKLPFKVPLVPLTPVVSVVVNIYLMLNLSSATWVRFGVWMAIGFLIYFGYGIRQDRNTSEQSMSRRILNTDGVDNTNYHSTEISDIDLHPKKVSLTDEKQCS